MHLTALLWRRYMTVPYDSIRRPILLTLWLALFGALAAIGLLQSIYDANHAASPFLVQAAQRSILTYIGILVGLAVMFVRIRWGLYLLTASAVCALGSLRVAGIVWLLCALGSWVLILRGRGRLWWQKGAVRKRGHNNLTERRPARGRWA